jgi:hypothetical protein
VSSPGPKSSGGRPAWHWSPRSLNSVSTPSLDAEDMTTNATVANPAAIPVTIVLGHPPDCDGFVRPGLPLGYAYVDQLRLGDAFRFTSRGSDADVRVAAHEPFALDEEAGHLDGTGCCESTPVRGWHVVRDWLEPRGHRAQKVGVAGGCHRAVPQCARQVRPASGEGQECRHRGLDVDVAAGI